MTDLPPHVISITMYLQFYRNVMNWTKNNICLSKYGRLTLWSSRWPSSERWTKVFFKTILSSQIRRITCYNWMTKLKKYIFTCNFIHITQWTLESRFKSILEVLRCAFWRNTTKLALQRGDQHSKEYKKYIQ